MTTQQRCWECGTIFTKDFGSFKCNVCHQAEKQAENFAAESQRNREHAERLQRDYIRATTPPPTPAPILTWFTEEEKKTFLYVPFAPEELAKQKDVKRMNTLLSLGVDLSLPIVWVFLWLVTSGWFTVVSFIAAIAIPFYLNEKHSEWKSKNAKDLYS